VLDFADDLVEWDRHVDHHSLPTRQMDRDVAGDLVDLLAARHEVCAREHLGCGEAFAGTKVDNDLTKHLEAYAGIAEFSGHAEGNYVAERVPLAEAAALRRNGSSEEPCVMPVRERPEREPCEGGGFLSREGCVGCHKKVCSSISWEDGRKSPLSRQRLKKPSRESLQPALAMQLAERCSDNEHSVSFVEELGDLRGAVSARWMRAEKLCDPRF
jgi:hypothetical protein